MTLTVTVQVPDHAPGPAKIVAIDLNAAGAAVASQRTLVLPGMVSTFHPHRTRTIQVIDTRRTGIGTGSDAVMEGKAMDFADAHRALKAGERVTRFGWPGRGAFVVLMPPMFLPPFNTQDTARKVNDRTAKWIGEDQPLDCQGYFAAYTAARQWQPGWIPSQADLLAEDWMVLPQVATPVIERPPS